jgi:hypothetical protein
MKNDHRNTIDRTPQTHVALQTSPAPNHALILRILEKAESDMAVFIASERALSTALDNLGEFYEYDSSLPLQRNFPRTNEPKAP